MEVSVFLISTTLTSGNRDPKARSSAHVHSSSPNVLPDKNRVNTKVRLKVVARMMMTSLNGLVLVSRAVALPAPTRDYFVS